MGVRDGQDATNQRRKLAFFTRLQSLVVTMMMWARADTLVTTNDIDNREIGNREIDNRDIDNREEFLEQSKSKRTRE